MCNLVGKIVLKSFKKRKNMKQITKEQVIAVARVALPVVLVLAGAADAQSAGSSPVNMAEIGNTAKTTIGQAGAVAGGVVAAGVAIRVAVKWGKAIAGMA